MKRSIPWLLMLVLVLVIGCGGGGGGGGTSGGDGGTGTYTNLQIGATVGGVFVDPTNIAVGETLSLTVYGRNESGVLVPLSASSWSTTAPASVATVSSAGTAVGISGSGSSVYTVTATAAGQTISSSLRVRTGTAKATGFLVNASAAGMRFAKVLFYNSAGTEVGSAVTGVSGGFRAVIPTDATKFTLDIETTDPTNLYYRQFTLGDDDYLMGESKCLAPVPTVAGGATAALGSLYLTAKASGPPGPPTGCVGG